MIDPTDIVKDVTGTIKHVTTNQQSARHIVDTSSKFMLPALIRPIIALVCLAMQILIFVAVFMNVELPKDLIYEVGALNLATTGFYFNSRRNEKINAKKTEAAIKIEEIRAKSAIKESRKNNKAKRKLNRKNKNV